MIGETGDFRARGFMQETAFQAQMVQGGVGSGLLPGISTPAWSSYQPFPLMVGMGPYSPAFFQQFGVSFPVPPVVTGNNQQQSGGGTTIVVEDLNTPQTINDVDTLRFSGAGLTVTDDGGGTATVDVPGGGGGTTLLWGVVTGYAVVTAGVPKWAYTVQPLVGGFASGGTITVRTAYEFANTATSAYGYTTTGAGGDQIASTSFYVRPIPVGALIPYVSSSDPDGTVRNWTFMCNFVGGSC